MDILSFALSFRKVGTDVTNSGRSLLLAVQIPVESSPSRVMVISVIYTQHAATPQEYYLQLSTLQQY
jgi:hypothetical protein